ncbi:HD domain-containing protein, partial [bacterium]|nr:HD domain-containing protein [bacterium]
MEESSRYALTYPQLVLQAAARGYDQAALSRLKRGHAFTLRVVDGRYRAQDVPFLCHLVRSASIAMWHGASEDVVLASLAHAVYAYGARRRAVADAIGPSAEKLVHAYEQSELFDERFLRERIANHASLSQMERDVMLMAFANELEDFLDQQMAFRAGDRYRETIAGKGALRVKLARLLGHAAL